MKITYQFTTPEKTFMELGKLLGARAKKDGFEWKDPRGEWNYKVFKLEEGLFFRKMSVLPQAQFDIEMQKGQDLGYYSIQFYFYDTAPLVKLDDPTSLDILYKPNNSMFFTPCSIEGNWVFEAGICVYNYCVYMTRDWIKENLISPQIRQTMTPKKLDNYIEKMLVIRYLVDYDIFSLIIKLLNLNQKNPLDFVLMKGITLQLVHSFFDTTQSSAGSHSDINDDDLKSLTKVYELMLKDVNKKYSLDDLVIISGMKKRTFQYKFKALFGETCQQVQLKARLLQAKKMLNTTDLSVREVALLVGFTSNFSAFARQYKRLFGSLPSQAKKKTLD